jgi:hypothetical protein
MDKIDMGKLTLLSFYINLDQKDFIKVVKFNANDWSDFYDYTQSEKTQRNELFDKMIQVEEED